MLDRSTYYGMDVVRVLGVAVTRCNLNATYVGNMVDQTGIEPVTS
jgi:hypothetical protein